MIFILIGVLIGGDSIHLAKFNTLKECREAQDYTEKLAKELYPNEEFMFLCKERK